jgi:peroxiredoxin
MKACAITRKCLAAWLWLVLGMSQASSQVRGTVAPDFALKSLAGENLRLSEFRGEVVLLAFGASWCGECRRDLEQLAAIHALYEEAGLRLLAVSVDASRRQAEDLAVGIGQSFPLLHDSSGAVAELYIVESLPTAVLIDRDGSVREIVSGYRRTESPPYLEPLRALLRE